MKKFGLNYPNSDRYAVIKKGLFVMKITLLLILISTFNLFSNEYLFPDSKSLAKIESNIRKIGT